MYWLYTMSISQKSLGNTDLTCRMAYTVHVDYCVIAKWIQETGQQCVPNVAAAPEKSAKYYKNY